MKTKTVWNLTEVSDFQDKVTLPFEAVPTRRREGGGVALHQWGGFRKIAVVVAASTVMTVMGGYATQPTFSIPLSSIVENSSSVRPTPLANAFAQRYTDEWNKEAEEKLLFKLSTKEDHPLDKETVIKNTVESIFFNLQEDVTSDSNRLSKAEIEKIIRQRKLV